MPTTVPSQLSVHSYPGVDTRTPPGSVFYLKNLQIFSRQLTATRDTVSAVAAWPVGGVMLCLLLPRTFAKFCFCPADEYIGMKTCRLETCTPVPLYPCLLSLVFCSLFCFCVSFFRKLAHLSSGASCCSRVPVC